jgi:hypothetical protein
VRTVLYSPEIVSASIVLLGKFNPAIFTPAWFAKVGIINEDELKSAVTQVVHPEVSQFYIERFRLEVVPTRFVILTKSEPFLPILEDVLTLFEQRLPHTPTNAVGINYEVEFLVDTFDQRTQLGRKLAPTGPWGKFGARLAGASQTENASGLTFLVMQETKPSDRERGDRRVQIKPSRTVDTTRGVNIQVNDHFEVVGSQDENGSQQVISILRDRFDASIAESKSIISELMEFAGTLK